MNLFASIVLLIVSKASAIMAAMDFPIIYPMENPQEYFWTVESSPDLIHWTGIPHEVDGDTYVIQGTPGVDHEFYRMRGSRQ